MLAGLPLPQTVPTGLTQFLTTSFPLAVDGVGILVRLAVRAVVALTALPGVLELAVRVLLAGMVLLVPPVLWLVVVVGLLL